MSRPTVFSGRFLRPWPCWWLLLLCLALPGLSGAAEFTALMVVKDGDKIMPGKIIFQNGKMRQEFQDEEGRTVTIVRPDKKLIWIVMPQDKTYYEIPLKLRLPGQFIQIPPDAIYKRLVGTETVNGYPADKYEVAVRGGEEGVTKETVWVAKKLEAPIKMVRAGKDFSVEYRNIKEGGLTGLLFEPPQGFKKMATPTGFTTSVKEAIE